MANMEYLNKYEKDNLRQIRLKINRKTEPELLEWIEKQDNIQGYIKRLIMDDMESNRPDILEPIQPVRFISENEQAWTDNNGIDYKRKKENGRWSKWEKDR